MFSSTITLFSFSLLTVLSHAATTPASIGSTGVLSSLDGGLGGTVTVTDASTLTITNYKLKDAGAPALYWWGTTDGVIKDGFRISNTQVTHAATSDTLIIKLDAGKTVADFNTVGLWCERLNANFGQATLTTGTGATSGTTSGTPLMTSASPSITMNPKSRAANTVVSLGAMMGALVAASVFAVLIG